MSNMEFLCLANVPVPGAVLSHRVDPPTGTLRRIDSHVFHSDSILDGSFFSPKVNSWTVAITAVVRIVRHDRR